MGVNTRITLPAGVRVQDVGTMLAILTHADRVGAYIPSLMFTHRGDPTCVDIEWTACEIDRHILYHFEFPSGQRGMMPPATAEWIAIGKRLVDFFGGVVDFADCDDQAADYVARARPTYDEDDEASYLRFQRRLARVKPLSYEEYRACDTVASVE